MTGSLSVTAPAGIGEVREGDDLAALVIAYCDLVDGDVVTITSKVVSKAEGRLRTGDRAASLAAETLRVVAQRGGTRIVVNRLGLTMAAAGIDASNVEPGRHLLLPLDPDGTARRVRAAVATRTGRNVAVLVTDTAGRAWRTGQTDIAIGAAGLRVTEEFAGVVDGYGNTLAVTAPAVADELAGAAELAGGKLAGRPIAVVRGRADLVLPAGEPGLGAEVLIRGEDADLFGLGAREAVVRAVCGRDARGFGAPGDRTDLAEALEAVLATDVSEEPDGTLSATCSAPYDEEEIRARIVAFAFGWRTATHELDGGRTGVLRFHPGTP